MKKVLIVKIGAIGDVCLALPLLDKLEGNTVDWVVGKKSSSILSSTERVQKLIVIDEDLLLYGKLFHKIKVVIKLWKLLFLRKYDLIITAHPDSRYRILSLFCFRKKHVFFRKKKNGFPISGTFHTKEYLNLLSGFASSSTTHQVNLRLPDIKETYRKLSLGAIVLYPGGTQLSKDHKSLRRWPVANYILLSKALTSLGISVVIIGSEDDIIVGRDFDSINVLNLIGKTSLLETLSVLKLCKGIVTHDGGPLHLARLVGCKICALFGPTSPNDISKPSSSSEFTIWGGDGLNCRPCYNGKNFKKCLLNSCVNQISVERVMFEISSRWGLEINENSNSP
ncbi:MAG: hypothetical protein S4CHLAM37_13280 [Chlamydiia bacterium]|nr:hypothetical protein [Chlamydiia bacterium]